MGFYRYEARLGSKREIRRQQRRRRPAHEGTMYIIRGMEGKSNYACVEESIRMYMAALTHQIHVMILDPVIIGINFSPTVARTLPGPSSPSTTTWGDIHQGC